MNSKTPYGYNPNEQGTRYQINPGEAEKVHRLIEQAATKEALSYSRQSEPAKRAAIYARSAVSQEQQNGLPFAVQEQIKQGQAYCGERRYAQDAERHIYAEVASGTNPQDNPQLTALRQAAHEGQFSIVVVSSFDRLARNSVQLAAILDDFKKAGVTVESVQEPKESLVFFKSVQDAFAEIERTRTVTRMKHGKAARKAQQQQ